MTLGAVFSDREVARMYRHRAPYPDEVLTTLRRLLVAPGSILDVGAGTGALARRMVSFAERVDAVDPSSAMIHEGRRLPAGADRRLHWIVGCLEDAPLSPPYGLITAGASLHWLDLDVALARLRDALARDAVMAIVDTEIVHGPYWPEVRAVIRRYSELEHHQETADLVEELGASGRFAIQGRQRTEPMPFEQSVDEYVGMLHSTSTLARVRLGGRASRFAADIRAVFARQGLDRVRFDVVGVVIWGTARATAERRGAHSALVDVTRHGGDQVLSSCQGSYVLGDCPAGWSQRIVGVPVRRKIIRGGDQPDQPPLRKSVLPPRDDSCI